jgi:ATP phosphoribosyltransferase regulatory subunit
MIATRMRGRPPPFRLAYEGTVMRRRSGQARKHRQIPQVGVELAGTAGAEGDFELLALAVDALEAAGLERFTIDLGDAGIVRGLLAELPAEHQALLSDALARKDEADLQDACMVARTPHAEVLRALPSLHGERDALVEGAALMARTPAGAAAARLLALYDAAVARGLGGHVTADLSEVRGLAYYTGTIFHMYAPGTGDSVGSGGRYDELLARFGWDLPAAGFGLDLDRVGEALRSAGAVEERAARVVVVGRADDARLADLRAKGIAAVVADDLASALQWARAWGFSHVLDATGWVDPDSGASIASPVGERGHR